MVLDAERNLVVPDIEDLRCQLHTETVAFAQLRVDVSPGPLAPCSSMTVGSVEAGVNSRCRSDRPRMM